MPDSECTRINAMLQERLTQERHPECDFCSAPRPESTFFRYYDCPDMACLALNEDTGEIKHLLNSERGFCACADCEKLIDAGKWQELEDRAVIELTVKLGFPVDRTPVRDLQTAFRRNHK